MSVRLDCHSTYETKAIDTTYPPTGGGSTPRAFSLATGLVLFTRTDDSGRFSIHSTTAGA